MWDLSSEILRLEIRAEQVIIHLRSMERRTGEAAEARNELMKMLGELRRLKEQRDRPEASWVEAA